MSRKSDIELARKLYEDLPRHARHHAIEAAYDLGRAAQAEKDARSTRGYFVHYELCGIAKRLRAKVRKAAGDKEDIR